MIYKNPEFLELIAALRELLSDYEVIDSEELNKIAGKIICEKAKILIDLLTKEEPENVG